MSKIFLILVLSVFPSKVFAKDIDLVCKINKESFHVFRELTEIADHPRRYVDIPVEETNYYKINVKDKSVIDLIRNKSKFYDLKQYVWIYKKHQIILDQVYKFSKNDKDIIFSRLSINKFTGDFLSKTKIIKLGDENRPINYNELVKKGECSKSKKLF